MRRMLTAKLQNRSGVLNRFTGVLSRRQVNIESISVGATENPNVSRITIIIDVASHDEVEQIIKQLNRQVDVIRVRDITDKPHLEREVILVKVSAPAEKRAEILAIIQPFRATVVDVAPKLYHRSNDGKCRKERSPHSCYSTLMGLKTSPAPVQPDLLEINSHLNIVNPALKRQIIK